MRTEQMIAAIAAVLAWQPRLDAVARRLARQREDRSSKVIVM